MVVMPVAATLRVGMRRAAARPAPSATVALAVALLLRPCVAAGFAAGSEAGVADDVAGPCRCVYGDNRWVYLISDLLRHLGGGGNFTENLATTSVSAQPLPRPAPQEALGFVLDRRCEEDASLLPGTDIPFDTSTLGDASQGGVGEFCIVGNVMLSLLCSQKFLAMRNIHATLKWIQATQHLLSFVQNCMDDHTPFPIRVADLVAYVEWWRHAPPLPAHDTRSFVKAAAFPGRARRKVDLAPCIPLRDPACFPLGTPNSLEACSECCSPEHGPGGNPQCWAAGFSFARCCNPTPVRIASHVPTFQTQDALNLKLHKQLEAEEAKTDAAIRRIDILGFELNTVRNESAEFERRALAAEAELAKIKQEFVEVEAVGSDSRALERKAPVEEADLAYMRNELEAERNHSHAAEQRALAFEADLASCVERRRGVQAMLETARAASRVFEQRARAGGADLSDVTEEIALSSRMGAELAAVRTDFQALQQRARAVEADLITAQSDLKAAIEDRRETEQRVRGFEAELSNCSDYRRSVGAELERARNTSSASKNWTQAEADLAETKVEVAENDSRAVEPRALAFDVDLAACLEHQQRVEAELETVRSDSLAFEQRAHVAEAHLANASQLSAVPLQATRDVNAMQAADPNHTQAVDGRVLAAESELLSIAQESATTLQDVDAVAGAFRNDCDQRVRTLEGDLASSVNALHGAETELEAIRNDGQAFEQRARVAEADLNITAEKCRGVEAELEIAAKERMTVSVRTRVLESDLATCMKAREALSLDEKVTALTERWAEEERRARDCEDELEYERDKQRHRAQRNSASHSDTTNSDCPWHLCLGGWCIHPLDCTR